MTRIGLRASGKLFGDHVGEPQAPRRLPEHDQPTVRRQVAGIVTGGERLGIDGREPQQKWCDGYWRECSDDLSARHE